MRHIDFLSNVGSDIIFAPVEFPVKNKSMLPPDLLNELKKCTADSAALMGSIHSEISKEANILAQSLVAKMNLVPYEEFAALEAVLQRTRAKVDQLQAELDALEKSE